MFTIHIEYIQWNRTMPAAGCSINPELAYLGVGRQHDTSKENLHLGCSTKNSVWSNKTFFPFYAVSLYTLRRVSVCGPLYCCFITECISDSKPLFLCLQPFSFVHITNFFFLLPFFFNRRNNPILPLAAAHVRRGTSALVFTSWTSVGCT